MTGGDGKWVPQLGCVVFSAGYDRPLSQHVGEPSTRCRPLLCCCWSVRHAWILSPIAHPWALTTWAAPCFLPFGVFFGRSNVYTAAHSRSFSYQLTTSYFHRPGATPPTTIPRSVFQSLKRQVIFGFGGKLLLRKQTAARCPQQLQREPPSDHSQGASAAAQKKSSTVMGRKARGATMPSHFHMQGAFILSFIN